MIDDFFEKHEISILTFVAGISVIMLIMFGGGMAAFIAVASTEHLVGEFSSKQLLTYIVALEIMMNAVIVIPNVLIIVFGKPQAVIVNKINLYFQFTCYSLYILTFGHDIEWFCAIFITFSLLAYWLMSTAKYQAFVAFYEALRKDPVGFRQRLLDRMHQ
ncbi:hypothetical protein [Photobacterium nomapromontoriensis]|uniref:hypothetical protein n=1 Tax=Photobacterium nomapromontoriensis TaxID=2910237 RepID=UPI003D136F7C